MTQCTDCKYCEILPNGQKTFKCDPFSTIIEPECLQKWEVIRLDMLVASYQSMLKFYQKMAPLQNKMFKYMEREIDEMDESEKWKIDEEDDDQSPDFT